VEIYMPPGRIVFVIARPRLRERKKRIEGRRQASLTFHAIKWKGEEGQPAPRPEEEKSTPSRVGCLSSFPLSSRHREE